MCVNPSGLRHLVALAVDNRPLAKNQYTRFRRSTMQKMTPRSVLRLTALAASTVAALWLAGCSSTATQNAAGQGPAPITDAKPGSNGASSSGANNGGVNSSAVKPVDLSSGNGANGTAGGANGAAVGAAGADAAARVVYFDFDSNVIKDEFRPVVEGNAKRLGANTARKVVIEGHTDERGGSEYNLALGQRRAEAVQKALSLLGVGGGQAEAVSFGKERPAVQGSGEEVWSKNRRAEIKDR
jgi:peptidoglycan-associated lipoprotein